jgi:hypothetical protein
MTEVNSSLAGSCTASTDCPMVNETCQNNLCSPKPCASDTDCPSEADSSGSSGYCLIASGTCQQCQRLQPAPTCNSSNDAACDEAADLNPVITSNCPVSDDVPQYCFTDSNPVTGTGNYCTTKNITCTADSECETW